MTEDNDNIFDSNFPPPLRGECPSDVSRPAAPGETYNQLFPWHLMPPTGTVVVIGPHAHVGDAHVPIPSPPADDLLADVASDDNYRMERRDVSYLNYILASWQRACIAAAAGSAGAWAFPTFDDVSNAPTTSTIVYNLYDHAGVQWRSSYFIKTWTRRGVYQKKIIVHLANDGYLYMNPALMGATDDVQNDRHQNTTPAGWMVFKTKTEQNPGGKREEIYEALKDFRSFAEAWFGTDDIAQSVLYNVPFRRIDICFKSKGAGPSVGLEFSFERDWQYPGDDPSWWD
jgi:hypothetical protein